jgi:glucokinase-like ROK family protein
MTPAQSANRDLIRAINRSAILNMIQADGPIARAEIARRTGLSPATVTGITADLISENLVFEKEAGDSHGGRPPILLALNPKGGYVIGIKLTETHAIAAMTDLEASVIAKQEHLLHGNTPEVVVRDLTALVSALLKNSGIQKKQLLGVGVGLAGIIDSNKGILRQSPISHWRDVPLRQMLQKLVRVPVSIDNDVNTLTLTEKWFGSGLGVENFLTITLGRGIGMGVVVNGQLYRGAGGGAGEFGHIVIDPEGPACECGKRGCLETYAADPGLLRMATEAFRAGNLAEPINSIDELFDLAKANHPAAREIYTQAAEILGRAIANLINVFNPSKVIISGEGARAGSFLFEPLCASVSRHVLPGLEGDTQIQIDPWGDDAWARGAAGLALHELFKSPISQGAEPLRR